MATSQLALYNQALLYCEERSLASLSEARKPRFLLDQVWNDGGVRACLEEGLWTFATRTESIVFDPNIQPAFGYIHAFQQPPDYIRTVAIASDAYFNSALTQYADEKGYWWGDLDTLFVKYVSDDPLYGKNLAGWPETFKLFVASHFASLIVKSLTHSKEIQDRVEAIRRKNLVSCRGKDGMNEPPGFFPRGQLSRARQGMSFGRPDRTGQGWY